MKFLFSVKVLRLQWHYHLISSLLACAYTERCVFLGLHETAMRINFSRFLITNLKDGKNRSIASVAWGKWLCFFLGTYQMVSGVLCLFLGPLVQERSAKLEPLWWRVPRMFTGLEHMLFAGGIRHVSAGEETTWRGPNSSLPKDWRTYIIDYFSCKRPISSSLTALPLQSWPG